MRHSISIVRSKCRKQNIVWLITLFLLAGCAASMQASKKELKEVTEEQGIIIGSVLISVEEGEADESELLAFLKLKGPKAGGMKYSLGMKPRGNAFSRGYSIVVTPGKEEVFIKNLPAGDYVINSIETAGFRQFEADLNFHLTVSPGKTIYVGRLVVNFPHRITGGTRFNMVVQDDQEKCVECLKKEHAGYVSDVVKGLMVFR